MAATGQSSKQKYSKSFVHTPRRRIWAFSTMAGLIGVVLLSQGFAAAPNSVSDFSTIFPNTSISADYYLNGTNYAHDNQSWSVLWFGDAQKSGTYKMYNSDPASADGTCHWDQFNWHGQDLLYSQTRNTCGNTDTDIQYVPALVYLPKKWNGSDWQKSGDSTAKYYENGELVCSGTNHWVTTIAAEPVELASGVTATHMQSTQTTDWTSGPGSTNTGCKPGETSRYQENLYFVTDLPIYSSQDVAPGLKRSVGGSLDFYDQNGWDWDIWFDNWKALP